jgi:antitoxin component of RelBE/YafQ-DinJ toxin-antitoxin module
MGKKAKAHRKKVQARNAKTVRTYKSANKILEDLGMTPEEALKAIQAGQIKKDGTVPFHKELDSTVMLSDMHTTRLAGT